MPITGNSADLSLVDLVQANVLVRNTCRITVAGPAGSGVLYLADGTVVHASYGTLEGRDAFFALVAAGDVFFQVETGFKAPRRTVHEKWENLALEAMRLLDEGKVPLALAAPPAGARAVAATAPPPATRISILPQEPVPQPAPFPARPASRPQAQRTPGRLPLIAGLAALAVLAAAGGYFALAQRSQKADDQPTAAAGASPKIEPVEASELTLPGDRRPVLVEGTPPPSPLPDLAVRPTIVCRILIGVDGKVQEAQVYQSRLDLAQFEAAALAAVRSYRFTPATRNATPVPVWINWPVSFE
ncbi:MAG: TonB family protein [Acidobacteriota bacterium]|jgi:TonB family protein